MQTTEQRLERLEKHNKRLTTALTLMAVAMCAVVHQAQDEDELRLFVDRLGVEVVVAEARPDRSSLN